MEQIIFSCHFEKIGWIDRRNNWDVLFFQNLRLEALRIENVNVVLETYSKKNGWQKSRKGEIAGSIGEKCPLYAITIDLDVKENMHIGYRVNNKRSGWNSFSWDGEKCGKEEGFEDDYIVGIQIVMIEDREKQSIVKKAEEKLEEYLVLQERLFVHDSEKLLKQIIQPFRYNEPLKVKKIEDALLLPLIKIEETADGIYSGGVIDSSHRFVAGLEREKGKRINFSCVEAYSVLDEKIDYRNEKVIFGGVFIKYFGHLMTECLSRLWYIISNPSDLPIVILTIPGHEKFAMDFFELLNIDLSRIEIVTKITCFQTIIVPEQSIYLWSGYHEEYISIYEKMRSNVLAGKYKKIYLTRTKLDKNDGVNEEFFEQFYKQRGFQIIAPEQYTIKEQVSIMAGAKEIVCTEGTLSHLVLFAQQGVNLTLLRRTNSLILFPQIMINKIKECNFSYIDVTHNLLPTKHVGGTFLYGPTEYFIQYLNRNNITYTDEDIRCEISHQVYKYLQKWCSNYGKIQNFKICLS